MELAAADAAAQLVQLREAEAVGFVDDHHRGVGNVDADLDDGCRHQHVDLAAAELPHGDVLFCGGEATVEKAAAEAVEGAVAEFFERVNGGAEGCFREQGLGGWAGLFAGLLCGLGGFFDGDEPGGDGVRGGVGGGGLPGCAAPDPWGRDGGVRGAFYLASLRWINLGLEGGGLRGERFGRFPLC